MKKNKIHSDYLNENIQQKILITENAIKQILFLINLNSNNKGIRLGIKKSGCAGFRYTMQFINNSELKSEKNTREIKFFYKNILIYITSHDMPFLEGVKIDFVKNSINKMFKFYNSKLENFCGCGESFQLMKN